MRKLVVIVWNELRLQVGDPILWLLVLAAPLLVAALITLAFGDLVLGQTMPETRIEVGIVNNDRGGAYGNLGQAFERFLMPQSGGPYLPVRVDVDIFSVRILENEAQAHRLIEQGELAAMLVIPPDFSRDLADENATLLVLVSGQEPALGQAFAGAVRAAADALSLGEVTIRTASNGMLGSSKTRAWLSSGMLDEALANLGLEALDPAANPIQIRRLSGVGPSSQLKLTHYLSAAIAITALGMVTLLTSAAIFQERAQHTLQRACMTPTPPQMIIIGKTMGAFLTGLMQIAVLIGGLMLFERLQNNAWASDHGLDPVGLGLLVGALVVATTGAGLAIAGLTRTYSEAVAFGGISLILMGLIGGIFFPVELLPGVIQAIGRGTYQFWAMDGYLKLERGAGAAALWPNLLVLLAFGMLTATLGYCLIRQRIEERSIRK